MDLLSLIFWLAVIGLVVAALFYFYWRGKQGDAISPREVRERFDRDKARLQDDFFGAASASGKPRGLRWKACQWNELTEWIRDKKTGQLLALVGVTISFEAIEGGDMEGVEAVGNLRNATAVFFFDGEWRTVGRTIYNLNPDEALVHFQTGYERVPMDNA